MADQAWPALPLAEWESTYATLHMWSQIVGKVTLALTPPINHWWNVAFQITPRGLTTPLLHYREERALQIRFDFITHDLEIERSDGVTARMALLPMSVAQFYRKFIATLKELEVEVPIRPVPVEVQNPVPFEQDTGNRSYDGEFSNRLWRILLSSHQVLNDFRSRFVGKCSPVHFFWGSFDLAVTRFSGRPAPPREGADRITREAYSQEVISHGFWPGMRASGAVEREKASSSLSAPAFYAYTAPEPDGFASARIQPEQAFYSSDLKEWVLPYEAVRLAPSPESMLLGFLQSTYEAGADLAGWDRAALERAESPTAAATTIRPGEGI